MTVINEKAQAPIPSRRDIHVAKRQSENTASDKKHAFYYPAADGLRGVAIASVVLYHTGWSERGIFGVDIFFVVSGFFITLLLTRELMRRDRVAVGSFYMRRYRRLLPGLFVVLVATMLFEYALAPLAELRSQGRLAIGSVFQAANWVQFFSGESYWEAGERIRPLAHMWSLSVTEQIYVVWPLLLWGLYRLVKGAMRPLLWTLVLLFIATGAYTLWAGANWSADRVYLGTDTRAVGFIAGAVVVVLVILVTMRQQDNPVRNSVPQRLANLLGPVALIGIIVASISAQGYQDQWLYRGGIIAVAALSAIVIFSVCVGNGQLSRALSWGPLCAFGRISYSVYLIHLPVFSLLQLWNSDISPMELLLVGGIITWILAAIIDAAVNRMRRRERSWYYSLGFGIIGASLATASAIVPVNIQIHRSQDTDVAPSAHSSMASMPSFDSLNGGRPLVFTMGDSLGTDISDTLMRFGTEAFAVQDGSMGGCGLVKADAVRSSSGYVWDNLSQCHSWDTYLPQIVEDTGLDAVVIHNSWDASDVHIEGKWLNATTPAHTDAVRNALVHAVDLVRNANPKTVVILVEERPANGLHPEGENLSHFNSVLQQVAAENQGVVTLDWNAMLESSSRFGSEELPLSTFFDRDDVHVSEEGKTYIGPHLELSLAEAIVAGRSEEDASH